jgi:hypothetical protein
MRKLCLSSVTLLLAVACQSDPAPAVSGSSSTTPPTTTPAPPPTSPTASPTPGVAPPADQGSGSAAPQPVADTKPAPPPPPPPLEGHDFTPEAKALLAVGACANLPPPDGFPEKLLSSHCDGTKNEPGVKKAQQDYLDNWVKPASAFFDEHRPKDLPKVVVYPFAGGDLSTALTVYPDADEITTMSLEPSGDPRDLATLKGGDLDRAMNRVSYLLKFLYRVNFSNTMDMIDGMRAGALPTELVFALSAMSIHGYEVVSLRYFKIAEDGTLHYLDDADIAKIPSPAKGEAQRRNNAFGDMELQFRKPGGRIQTYRHIVQNLDNEHLKATPGVLKYLEARGDKVAGMTKAASYLLSWEGFSTIRDYLTGHVVWMVSDATGVAPKWGKPAGFEYETYGSFVGPHIPAGSGIAKDWRAEFDAEPKRDLPFRFGYYDVKLKNHLIIMRKKAA